MVYVAILFVINVIAYAAARSYFGWSTPEVPVMSAFWDQPASTDGPKILVMVLAVLGNVWFGLSFAIYGV